MSIEGMTNKPFTSGIRYIRPFDFPTYDTNSYMGYSVHTPGSYLLVRLKPCTAHLAKGKTRAPTNEGICRLNGSQTSALQVE